MSLKEIEFRMLAIGVVAQVRRNYRLKYMAESHLNDRSDGSNLPLRSIGPLPWLSTPVRNYGDVFRSSRGSEPFAGDLG